MSVSLICGNCLDIMPTLEANSIDSIVCDPPYGLSFMGKDWDHGVPGVAFWEAALRVAKPGAMLLAFGGTRTFHRLTVAIEDAGWEIRDCLTWLYGSGFPKSHDISKAIDKAAGAEREVIGIGPHCGLHHRGGANNFTDDNWVAQNRVGDHSIITAPATDESKKWNGYGTALKPAWEPIILAMKPLDKNFAQNALKWGVAGLNIDASRISHDEPEKRTDRTSDKFSGRYNGGENGHYRNGDSLASASSKGRWPANLILDEEAALLLDEMSGVSKSTGGQKSLGAFRNGDVYGKGKDIRESGDPGFGDTGGASRFFLNVAHDKDDIPSRMIYQAKASKRDRDEGLDGMEERSKSNWGSIQEFSSNPASRNHHPTVKPTQLMRYLVRLVTPQNGTVLDPFLGSGSTLKAAVLEGFNGVGIELDSEYLEIARKRIEHAEPVKIELPLQMELV